MALKLMDVILDEAKQNGARMVVLETQTCNLKAISFYKKNGFDIIGFDSYLYSNEDLERHEVILSIVIEHIWVLELGVFLKIMQRQSIYMKSLDFKNMVYSREHLN